MKFEVKILSIEYVNEINQYWSDEDLRQLLKLFDFGEADDVAPNELREMLFMAITDFEPDEAAKVLLEYKLGDRLKKGQIDALSHEMIDDKVAEEYPDTQLHYELFNVNQLLYKAFDGTFPNTEASIIDIEIHGKGELHTGITPEIMAKIFRGCLSGNSIINRLYAEQLNGEVAFGDAAKFIWEMKKTGENKYQIITSRYWAEKDDVVSSEYEIKVKFFEEGES